MSPMLATWMVRSGGACAIAARSRAVLNDALRRLPEIPSTRTASFMALHSPPRRGVVKRLRPFQQELVRPEGALVAQRRAPLDAVSEIDVGPGGRARVVDERQDVRGAERQARVVGVVEEERGRQRLRRRIEEAQPDELAALLVVVERSFARAGVGE